MSQVKKLQSGGTFTIDGIKYKATPEFINSLTTHLRDTAGTDAQTLAGLTTALQNGEDLTYNSASNTITGMDGLWGGITERQDRRRDAGSSRWRKWWEAQFDTDAHRFRNALSAIGSFHYQVPKTEEEVPSNLKDIYGNSDWFDYITGDDGTVKWSDNSSRNAGLMQRLDDMTAYLRDPETGKKTYRLASEYTPQHMSALQGLYDQDKDRWDDTLNQIKERARNNQLDDADKAFLKNFFIVKPSESAEGTTDNSGLSTQDRQRWNDAGHGALIDLLGDRAYINDDGSISLMDGANWGWNLGDLEGYNIWFNDDFYNSIYGADGTFDPYRNYTLYNNRLYALDNPTLAKILNVDSGFNSMMKSGNWNGADDLILTRFTEGARENPEVLGADQYSEFLYKNPSYRFSDLTGLVDLADGTPLGDNQVVQYVDLNDDSLVGPYRRYNYKYALLDNRGKLIRDLNSEDIIRRANGVARDTGLNTYKRTTGNNGIYDNRYYEDIVDAKGDPTGFRFYNSIENPNEDVILHMPDIYASDTEDKDIVLPKGVAKALMSDTSWLNNIVGNAQNKKNFMKILSALVQSWWRKSDTLWYRNEANQLRKMGFSDSQINTFIQAFNEAKKGSRAQRRSDMLVNAPTFQKQGGVLEKQDGGTAGGSRKATGITERKTNAVNKNPKNSAGITEIGSDNWTDADTADMVALIADLGSLAAAIAPGANAISAATGAVGSTSRFYADKQRGTQGAGLNYLVNLGMDAATLIPLLGAGAKGAKVIKGVKAALPTIIKAASVYGLGAGFVDAAKKVASGQKFTVRDVDMLINGLTAGIGLGKSGGFGKPKASKAVKDINVTGKAKVADGAIKPVENVGLTGKELSELKDVESAKKLVVNRAKSLGDTDVTLENVGERYDLSNIINSKQGWKPGISPKNWGRTVTKESIAKFKPTETGTIQPSNTAFGRWWKGENGINQVYNQTLRGENPGIVVVKSSRTRTYQPKTITYKGKQITFTPEEVQQIAKRSGDIKGLFMSKLPKQDKKNWTRLYHEFLAVKNPTKLEINSEQIPVWYRSRLFNDTWVQPGLKIKVGPVASRTRIYDTGINLAIPQVINGSTAANFQLNEDEQPSGFVRQPVFKKGGALKAQFGTTLKTPTFNINQGLGTPIKDKILENVGQLYTAPTGTAPTFVPTTPKPLDASTTNFKVINPMTGQTAVSTKQAASNSYEEPTFEGTFSERKWNPDLNVPMNWVRSLYAMKQSDKQLKNFLNRPDYQPSDLLLNAPRFINTGSGNAYRKQADVARMSKSVQSDALKNDLMQRERQQQAMQLELQGDLADSQEYGQYKAGLDQFLTDYAKQRYNIAEQAKQLRWQRGVEDVQATNANIAEKSKFFDQAAYATQDWWNRNYQGLNQINALDANQAEIAALEKEYATKMSDYRARYANDPNSDAAVQELAGINSWLNLRKQGLGKAGALEQLSPSFRNKYDRSYARYAKKGGKVGEGKQSAVTYSRDPYPELLIQNSKDSAEAVKQLNDAVIKLLLQTKPINVH